MKIDAVKEMCHKMNTVGEIKGYWWKTYRGGYGGCCKSLDNLAPNWPDANTYSLEYFDENTSNTVANQNWKIVYTDGKAKEATSGLDKEHGLHINRPFYIRSRMPMQRVMEAIGASNVTLKKYYKNRLAQQWRFDRVTNTIKNQQWKNYSLEKTGGNLTVRTTTSRWN